MDSQLDSQLDDKTQYFLCPQSYYNLQIMAQNSINNTSQHT